MSEQPIAELYHAAAMLAVSLRITQICEMDGCWEHQIDDEWWVAANGHKEPTKCSKETEIPAFHFYFERNGWPAALVGPYDGTVLANWSGETLEDDLIAAIKAATHSRERTGS